MTTLLEKALAIKTGSNVSKIPFTQEEAELLKAYLKGEITVRQYGAALGLKDPGQATHRIGSSMKKSVDMGYITIS